MTTVGEILKSARERKKFTLTQVENALKIRAKFLMALENNQFDQLPPGTFAKGFIKNYAAYLGLPVDDILAFYRRQVHEKIPNVAPENKSGRSHRFAFTPQMITPISVGLLLFLFFAYLIFAYFRYAGSPMLEINAPKNNLVVREDQVDVTGRTDPDATLIINNEPVNLSESGSFDVKITLQPGLNTIILTATNKFHRQSTVTRNLRLEK